MRGDESNFSVAGTPQQSAAAVKELGDILEKNNEGHLTLKKESDILQSCLITERGEIRNKQLRQHYKSEGV